MFRIKGRTFVVREAEIWAVIMRQTDADRAWPCENEGIAWSINIEAERDTFDGLSWEPRAYLDGLVLKLRHWKELDGQFIRWTDWMDRTTRQTFGSLYVFEHTGVRNSNVSFSNRRGTIFDFRWMGFCDMFYDEEFTLNLPLLIETKMKFNGISVANESDPKQARMMLSQYCNPDEFVQHPVCMYGEENNPCHAILFEPVTSTTTITKQRTGVNNAR